jgi:hypothetical protein
MTVSWLAPGLAAPALNLFAQATPRGGAVPNLDARPLVWLYLILLAVALVGVLLLYFVARWRKRAGQERQSASEQLSDFRALYEQGELSREEFDRVRSLLGERLRKEIDTRTAPAAAGPPGPPSPPSPPPQTEPPPAGGIQERPTE